MDIVNAKRQLFDKLKSNSNVLGAGIKGSGKAEYIVIFVKKTIFARELNKIIYHEAYIY